MSPALGETGRGARLGWFSSANDLGATAGPRIGGIILFATASFSLSYLLVGLLGVVAMVLAFLVPEQEVCKSLAQVSLTERAVELRDGLREVLTTPAVLTAAAVEATMMTRPCRHFVEGETNDCSIKSGHGYRRCHCLGRP